MSGTERPDGLEPAGATRLLVLPVHDGLRLDRFLAEATALSRRRARQLAAAGLVWRNGRPARVLSRPVRTADVVDVLRPHTELGVPREPDPPRLAVLHRDRWIVAVDKPAGVLSQPSERRDPAELAADERLRLQLALETGRRPDLHLVHRLDRLTSGVLLFSRHHRSAAALSEAWRRGAVERLYLAVVVGEPEFDERVVEAPIARDRSAVWRFTVSPRGRPATTRVEVLARHSGLAFVACRLVTGRTHQVRVHMAHLGHPVSGDALYGGGGGPGDRPLLHAYRIELPHPRTGEPLAIAAPLPPDMAALWPPGAGPPGGEPVSRREGTPPPRGDDRAGTIGR